MSDYEQLWKDYSDAHVQESYAISHDVEYGKHDIENAFKFACGIYAPKMKELIKENQNLKDHIEKMRLVKGTSHD